MSSTRKPLTNIVPDAGGDDDILDTFENTAAAADLAPVPKGSYVCLAVRGERTTAKTGTSGYCVGFRIIEGEYTGRQLWRTWFFTEAAMPYTRRDLEKFGISTKAKLLAPFPANRMVFKLAVTLRRADDDTERNEVKNLELVRVQEPEADPFAPEAEGGDR